MIGKSILTIFNNKKGFEISGTTLLYVLLAIILLVITGIAIANAADKIFK